MTHGSQTKGGEEQNAAGFRQGKGGEERIVDHAGEAIEGHLDAIEEAVDKLRDEVQNLKEAAVDPDEEE